ncbi:General transcription factor IIH subunit 4 [Myotis brandtii]|uniref:General transcription factor IIH subunit 4 n=1 Tax=Myotis brandtii TaxID=109478 RepID=S7NKV5_MYOBR|nr:General transcription factor IIH subunit 4 [Myotis brandtii]
MVVAQVTRESVQQAITSGITPQQIIHFLRTRAHPVMLKQTPVLPPTITDQIRLWELERDRLRFTEGVLYNQFLSQVDFELLLAHARELGVLVFENASSLCHKLLWPCGSRRNSAKLRRKNLRTALLGGGKAWSDDTSQLGPDKYARDVPSLDKYAEERWEVVLHFMVGSPSAAVSQDLAQLLSQAGLMKSAEPGEPPCITSAGFQFLLLDTPAQLWYFMLQYLQMAQSRGMDLVEILSFLFQLSFSTLGKDYSVEGMSDSLLNFLQHLREFGLVFQRKRKSRRYYPTRLAINLLSGVSGAGGTAHQPGFIVVETNYRLYACTESELQIALIALFSEMLYRFPSMVVAQVTRESVQQAITSGITPQQIIHFLRTRAHPVMLKQTPVLPPTITDQIRLWELERDRLRFTEGVLYNQFLSQVDFELLLAHARELGVLVFENAAKRLMVVTPAGHRDVKRFWKWQKHSS